MLNYYVMRTQQLLQLPAAPASLYPVNDIKQYINIARGQLAGEGECVRRMATVSTVIGQRDYAFEDLNFTSPTGISGAIHVRRVAVSIGEGQLWMTPRPFEWFDLYCLNNVVPPSGVPDTWAQFQQGAAPASTGAYSGGTFYIDPIPDSVYELRCDCVCYPIPLVLNTDPEVIPYLWTDAVPFLAAYYALLSAQTGARMNDADRMMAMYTQFVQRARTATNPSVNRWQYEQAPDPVQARKLGAN